MTRMMTTFLSARSQRLLSRPLSASRPVFLVCLPISPVLRTCSDSFFCKHNKIIANSAVIIFLYRSNLIVLERERDRDRHRQRQTNRQTDREHFYKDFRLDCPVDFISNSENELYSLCLPNNLPGIFYFTVQLSVP